jgi:hypothetical protein
VRIVLFFLWLTVWAGAVRAQEQENKMVDRLLKPDMTLANPAQNKQFNGTGTTSVDKKFVAKSFYSGNEANTKAFTGERDFSAKGYETGKSARTEKVANASGEPTGTNKKFSTGQSSLVRTAPENGKAANTRDYPENRPFLGKGTRQEILSKQNQPLTIDEIRELLNKSK